jgi:hypothetical protein
MFLAHLHDAGFFPIQWAPVSPDPVPGHTYVLPSAKGVLRVFVPAEGKEMELYAGSLANGQLRYRGPVPNKAKLQQLLVSAFSGRVQ